MIMVVSEARVCRRGYTLGIEHTKKVTTFLGFRPVFWNQEEIQAQGMRSYFFSLSISINISKQSVSFHYFMAKRERARSFAP
jgi:hypothetical protein